MLYEKDLNKIAEKYDLTLCDVSMDLDALNEKAIMFKSLDSLLSFGYQMDCEVLYYDYETYLKEPFIIPDEYRSSFPSSIQPKINEKINEYNDYVNSIDFDESAYLTVFFLYEGFIHFCTIINEKFKWLTSYEEKIKEIKNDISSQLNDDQLSQIRLEAQREKDNKLAKLKEIIINDEEFHNATNLPLRREYAHRLFEIHPEYRETLKEVGYTFNYLSFIDVVWKEYKRIKKGQ